jgi:hypothetical protein
MAVVRVDVDRPFEQERLIQTSSFSRIALCRRSISAIRCAASVFSSRQACITRSWTRRMKPAVG